MAASGYDGRMSTGDISLRGIGKRFANGVHALVDFSLELAAGEFVALLGPSGCGKSTVLRIVAELDTPSIGTVQRSPQVSAHGTAFVFQDPTLMPWASVFDNVALPLRLAGHSRREVRPQVEAMLTAVGLRDFAHQAPATLSGGMRMRASIARALVTEPEVLLMDEPFAALDEITRARLNQDLIAWWRARQLSVMFVTHSVQEAVFLADRVIVMGARPGRVLAELKLETPQPRGAAHRNSPAFHEACRFLSEALESAHADSAP